MLDRKQKLKPLKQTREQRKLHKIVHGRGRTWAGPCEHLNNRSAGFLEGVGNSPQTFVRSHVQRKQHGEIEG